MGTLEAGQWCDLAIWDIERPAELVYRIGFNPLHAPASGGASDRPALIEPRETGPGDTRRTGAPSIAARDDRLDPAGRPRVAAGRGGDDPSRVPTSRSMESIPASGSWRIDQDRARPISRRSSANIVLSHAAGVGEPMPVPVVRLMLALKLTQPARRLGGAPARDRAPAGDAAAARHTGYPGARLGRRERRSCPARAYGLGDDRRGQAIVEGEPRAGEATCCPPARAADARPKEGLALLNGTQFSCAFAARRRARGRARLAVRRSSPAR